MVAKFQRKPRIERRVGIEHHRAQPFIDSIRSPYGGFVTTGDYSEDLHELASGEVASFLGLWVILPTLLGVVTRIIARESCVSDATPYLKLTNYCVLLLLNYSNASLTLPNVISHPDLDFSRDNARHRLSSLHKRIFIGILAG